MDNLAGRKILITGASRRIGKHLAIAAAKMGASILMHYGHSSSDAVNTVKELKEMGADIEAIQADFKDPKSAIIQIRDALAQSGELFALVNNASLFQSPGFKDTTLDVWQTHMNINLTMPFLLCQLYAEKALRPGGRIINILDWRALRPGRDHFPYTIAKAALAAMTKSTAIALAPDITVNALALGAILPPSDGELDFDITKNIPARRWAEMKEVEDTFLFLLNAPAYITGEIIHVDGGRHLV